MKKIILNLILIVSLGGIFISCSKKDKTGLLIPKDAAMVIHFNAASFSSKLSWDDIKATNWFKKFNTESHDSLTEKLMMDPASSGIDLKSDFVYFIKMRTSGAYIVADGKLKDADAFAAYCKKMMPNGSQSQDGDFSFITKDDNAAVIWNKERFAFVANTPGIMGNRFFNNENPSSGMKNSITADSLEKYGKEVLNLSNTQTLGTDDHFAELVNEPGDVHMWVDIEKLYSIGAISQYLSMMKVSTLFEGNKYALTLNFDNGKISLKGKHYQGDEMTRLLKKYPPQPMDAALIKRLPAENVMMAFAINFQPDAMNEMIKTIGMDGMLNLLLGKANLTLDDITKANKGQMLFALTGVNTKEITDTMSTDKNKKPLTFTHKEREVKFVFANAINNKGAFDRLLELLKESTEKMKSSSNYTFKVKDNWFAAGDSANVSAFLSGNSNAVPYADRISGHPMGAYIDFQKIISHLLENTSDSSKTAILSVSKNMWQDAVMTGGDFSNGAVTFSMEVNLVDKNTNSLKQLNHYFDQVATAYKGRFPAGEARMYPLKMDEEKSK